MSLWRQLTRGLRALRNRAAADEDIAGEIDHYLDEATAAHIARGVPPVQARRQARVEFGGVVAVREQVRSSGWEDRVDTLFTDVRYAARRLRRSPGFTAVSIMTLVLGIGASTAIFSVIDGVLLKPLPYPHSDRLVALLHTAPGVHIEQLNMAASLYFTYSEESRVFQDVGMWIGDSWGVTGLGEPQIVPGLSVTHGFLPALGVQPAFGRGFTVADEDMRSQPTVILSDGYWRSRFGADRSVLGRRILMDGDARTIIGVLPPSFEFMDQKFSILALLRFRRAEVSQISFCCSGIARLKPGVTLEQANADIARMLPLVPAKFRPNPGWSPTAFTNARIAPRLQLLKNVLLGDIGNTLWVLMGAVIIVLSIACANVANLLLVRADQRRHELAVSAALGAGWGRLARGLLLESLMLSIAGGALGLALAYAAIRILVASDLPSLPRIHDISIDPAAMAFTLGISLASGLLFGFIPVLKYARPRVSGGLRSEGRALTASRERHRARSALVALQVALALVLLIGSGLMIRTFRALRSVDPGFFKAENLETVRIGFAEPQEKDEARLVRMQERVFRMEQEILRKIEAIPGVSTAAAISMNPMEGGPNDPVFAEDQPSSQGSLPPVYRFKYVSPGYFSTAGSRLIAGRDLTWEETVNRTPVALVSENLARALWRDPRAALGKRIRVTAKDDWREVIGVVSDLHDDGIDQKAATIVYWPLLLKNFESTDFADNPSLAYLLRTPRAGSSALLRDLQAVADSVDPSLALADVKTLESIYDRSLARTTLTLVLLAVAGGMALVLWVIGIYGVISYSVSQRTREIGIRLALGAQLGEVIGLFVRHGLAISGIGAVFGLTAALTLTHLMKSLLFEVSPIDPLTYAAASLGLILAAVLGSCLPALRAARIDPAEALRSE